MRSNSGPRYGSLAVLALTLAAGCADSATDSATAPSVDVTARRAAWAAHGLTAYEYDYQVGGFLISYAGHRIHLVVRNGAVQSATDMTTGQAAPGPGSAWPTIDALFDEATQAATEGSLRGIRFDPTLDYPTEIDLAGPPDASGSVFASGLQAVQ